MSPPRVLVVDDRDVYVRLCHEYLRDYVYETRCDLPGPCWTCDRRAGCTLTHAHSWTELDEALGRASKSVDVILLDIDFRLPVEELLPRGAKDKGRASIERLRRYQGIEILRELRRVHGLVPVVLMTAYEDLAFEEDADALAAEEYTYFAGEDATDARALGLLIERIASRRRAETEVGGFFWGTSDAVRRLRQRAEILARGDRPILILGETGTGKSLLAERVIHPATLRKGRFCSVDLSALPSTLVTSELFGTTRGAFSGAADRPGRFEHADGGTVLLDEIGHLTPEAQRALLAVLQDRRVTRLGSNDPRPVDIKLIAATNEDLAARVTAGDFRADLMMRLNPAASLCLPPLRERREDIPPLFELFARRCFSSGGNRAMLDEYAAMLGLGPVAPAKIAVGFGGKPPADTGICFVLQRKTVDLMKAAPWPGNVRQLELLVESALVSALGDALRAAPSQRASERFIPVGAKLVRDLLQAVAGAPLEEGGAEEQLRVQVVAASSLHEVSRGVERQYLEALYRRTGGDFARMAGTLLGDPTERGARRVRLRFNQIGLRVRGAQRPTE